MPEENGQTDRRTPFEWLFDKLSCTAERKIGSIDPGVCPLIDANQIQDGPSWMGGGADHRMFTDTDTTNA
jgi:hypothetical protein